MLTPPQFEHVKNLYQKLDEWATALGIEPEGLVPEIRRLLADADEGRRILKVQERDLFGRITEVLELLSFGQDIALNQERAEAKAIIDTYLLEGHAITRNSVRTHCKKKQIRVDVMQAALREMIEEGRVVQREDGKLLKPSARATKRTPEVPSGPPPLELELHWKNVHASCVVREGCFIVLKGSTASAEATDCLQPQNIRRRQALIQDGILAAHPEDSALLHFTCEAKFTSPSTAAAIIAGTVLNGRVAWHLKGKATTYKEWQTARS